MHGFMRMFEGKSYMTFDWYKDAIRIVQSGNGVLNAKVLKGFELMSVLEEQAKVDYLATRKSPSSQSEQSPKEEEKKGPEVQKDPQKKIFLNFYRPPAPRKRDKNKGQKESGLSGNEQRQKGWEKVTREWTPS
jgi:hypothetical protein